MDSLTCSEDSVFLLNFLYLQEFNFFLFSTPSASILRISNEGEHTENTMITEYDLVPPIKLSVRKCAVFELEQSSIHKPKADLIHNSRNFLLSSMSYEVSTIGFTFFEKYQQTYQKMTAKHDLIFQELYRGSDAFGPRFLPDRLLADLMLSGDGSAKRLVYKRLYLDDNSLSGLLIYSFIFIQRCHAVIVNIATNALGTSSLSLADLSLDSRLRIYLQENKVNFYDTINVELQPNPRFLSISGRFRGKYDIFVLPKMPDNEQHPVPFVYASFKAQPVADNIEPIIDSIQYTERLFDLPKTELDFTKLTSIGDNQISILLEQMIDICSDNNENLEQKRVQCFLETFFRPKFRTVVSKNRNEFMFVEADDSTKIGWTHAIVSTFVQQNMDEDKILRYMKATGEYIIRQEDLKEPLHLIITAVEKLNKNLEEEDPTENGQMQMVCRDKS